MEVPQSIAYKDVKEKLLAAQSLLSASSTTIDKLRSIKTILAGASPTLDVKLRELDQHLVALQSIEQGAVLSLTAHRLPESTDEERRRKKVLLLFLKYRDDLQSEVARVQEELKNQEGGSSSVSTWGRILGGARGPLAIITIVAVGIAILAATSVDITIENHGCGTLYAGGGVPISLPGLALPKDPIGAGESAVATIPPLTLTVDATKAGTLALSSLKFNFTIELSNSVVDVTFDGVSLLGTKTELNLSDTKTHTLALICTP